ncbi:phosphatidylethanolamine N-methyltransferase isoform X2 [Rhinatrema bivittatum]|uniref:phosphatidylethanolamine N-methyltransferase isoform X2 n=1 Tax=Rhinatrema bivittatum TaxID=194408 RepID=UPI00112B315D|nr:phosphatidylethanolamine N-methyltransferase isoform X2 [Rhinatrema bivittatum]
MDLKSIGRTLFSRVSLADSLALPTLQLDCCGGLSNLDYRKVDFSVMMGAIKYVDLTDSNFAVAVLCIIFNPLFWNAVARWEHKTRSLTRLLGSPYTGCYCLGVILVLLAILRSHCFAEAMKSQPRFAGLDFPGAYYTGLILLASGVLFVVSSFSALGFVGTYLGDYFGILMKEKVTGFPFNIMENPMYWGSTVNYLGWSLMPFTEEIYREKQNCGKNK